MKVVENNIVESMQRSMLESKHTLMLYQIVYVSRLQLQLGNLKLYY